MDATAAGGILAAFAETTRAGLLAILDRRHRRRETAPREVLSVRTERWEAARGETFLLAVAFGTACVVHAVRIDPEEGRLWWLREVFDADAVLSDRDALCAAMLPLRMTNAEARALKLFDDVADGFGHSVRDLALGMSVDAHLVRAGLWTESWKGMLALRRSGMPLHEAIGGVRRRAPERGRDVPHVFEVLLSGMDGAGRRDALDSLGRFVAGWHAGLVSAARPEGLPRRGWTERSYDHLDAPSETRRRRIQAIALQPLFIDVLLGVNDVAALVDEGRPFEMALAQAAFGAGYAQGRPDVMARVRRLRTYPWVPPDQAPEVSRTIWMAKALPLDRLPLSAEGWRRLGLACHGALSFADRHRLPMEPLLAGLPRDWGIGDLTGVEGADDPNSAEASRQVHDAGDLVRLFLETVLLPAYLQGLLHGFLPDHGGRVAADLLYGGRTFRGILQVSREWHAGQRRIDGGHPAWLVVRSAAWRPLFDPVRTDGGIVLRCLTDGEALRDEGADGPDGDGVEGLAHCVGGYAKRCLEGTTHIVSISVGEGTARRRLSTAEIEGTAAPFAVVQHRGPSNAAPPPEAVEALDGLVAGLRTGSIPVLAVGPVTADEDGEDFDVAAAALAWRPYLTARGRAFCERMLGGTYRRAA